MWEKLKVPLFHWPDLSQANVGDQIFYCYHCTYQNNVTQNGTGSSMCPCCKKPGGFWNSGREGLRIWLVEPGEKEKQQQVLGGN